MSLSLSHSLVLSNDYWLHSRKAELAKNSKLVWSCCHFRQNSVMALPVMVNPLPGKSKASRTSLGSGSSPRPWTLGTQIPIGWGRLLTFKSGQGRQSVTSVILQFPKRSNTWKMPIHPLQYEPPQRVQTAAAGFQALRHHESEQHLPVASNRYQSSEAKSAVEHWLQDLVQGMMQLRCVGRSKTLRTSGSRREVASARMKLDLVLVPFFICIAWCRKQRHDKSGWIWEINLILILFIFFKPSRLPLWLLEKKQHCFAAQSNCQQVMWCRLHLPSCTSGWQVSWCTHCCICFGCLFLLQLRTSACNSFHLQLQVLCLARWYFLS